MAKSATALLLYCSQQTVTSGPKKKSEMKQLYLCKCNSLRMNMYFPLRKRLGTADDTRLDSS